MVQFGPYNWVDLAPKIGAKNNPISMGTNWPQACTKLDSLVLAPFLGPKQLFTLYTVYSYSFALFSSYTAAVMPLFTRLRPVSFATGVPPFFTVALLHTCMRSFNPEIQRSFVPYYFTLLHPLLNQPINNYWSTCFPVCLFGSFFFLILINFFFRLIMKFGTFFLGICYDVLNGYTCQCYDGFTGYDCAVNIDECKSNPCIHGRNLVLGLFQICMLSKYIYHMSEYMFPEIYQSSIYCLSKLFLPSLKRQNWCLTNLCSQEGNGDTNSVEWSQAASFEKHFTFASECYKLRRPTTITKCCNPHSDKMRSSPLLQNAVILTTKCTSYCKMLWDKDYCHYCHNFNV